MKKMFVKLVVTVFAGGVFVAALFSAAATAAVITVNSAVDADGSTPDGKCSLREAVLAANADTAVDGCVAGSGDDTVVLPAGTYVLAIAGTNEEGAWSGDLDITGNLVLVGAGAGTTILDGGGIDRVLHVDPACAGIVADISGVTLRNGLAPDAPIAEYDKASGGGIHNCGTLSLSDVVVSGNSAPYFGQGGGIHNKGLLLGRNVTVSGNSAYRGGGMASSGSLMLADSGLEANGASGSIGTGGGLYNIGDAVLVSVTVHANSAINGGGISNGGDGGMKLINSTVSNNLATWSIGGGVYNEASCEVTNSTISGNSAKTSGGGIANKGLMSLASTTIANNTAVTSGGALFIYNQGLVEIANSLLAGNTVGGVNNICAVPVGSVTSYGYNLADCPNTCGLDEAGDKTVADAHLGALQNNGGKTLTHALLAGSLAIDGGNPAGCTAEGGTRFLMNDQRSFLRPVDGDGNGTAVCDTGAFESGAVAGPGSDLSIRNLDLPDPVAVDGTLTYNIVATNNGPEMAEGIVVTITLPAGVEWISTSANTGTCVGTGTVRCYVGNLFTTDAAMISISVRPTVPEQLFATAVVTSGTPDPAPGNNTDTALTLSVIAVRRVQGTTIAGTYATIQAALDAAASGDIIQSVLMTFSENPVLNSSVPVTLKGGYDPAFSSQSGYTLISGTLTLAAGAMTVDRLILQ
jgi:CSLREA domain-containing protein/uncharacterized repeat protein (TIGR01451 family)